MWCRGCERIHLLVCGSVHVITVPVKEQSSLQWSTNPFFKQRTSDEGVASSASGRTGGDWGTSDSYLAQQQSRPLLIQDIAVNDRRILPGHVSVSDACTPVSRASAGDPDAASSRRLAVLKEEMDKEEAANADKLVALTGKVCLSLFACAHVSVGEWFWVCVCVCTGVFVC